MLKPCGLFALCLSIAHPLSAVAQAGPAPQYWPGPWHMWGGGWGFGWIFPLLMMVVFAAICAFLISRMSGHDHARRDTTSSALRLLNERFAKGEISKEEFQEKRSVLGG